MTIYDKGLIRAMKSAYRDGGYDLAMTLILGERVDTRLLGGVIYLRSWAGTIYVRPEMNLPEDRALLQHLAEMQWIPVEAE